MSFGEDIVELVQKSDRPVIQIANHWERVPLGEVAQVLNGYAFKSKFFNETQGFPLIRIRDVTSGTVKTLYVGEVPEGYWVEPGELIVGMDGDFNSRMWGGPRALLNQRVCKLTPNPNFMNIDFLYAVLPGYLQLINDHTSAVTVKHLSSRTLTDTPIPLPPLPEQQRIVRKLDTLSTRTTTARTHLTAIAKLLEKYREAVLEHAFKGTLTDKQALFSGCKSGAALLEDIRAERKSHWLQTERAKKQAKGLNTSDASILKRYKPPEAIAEINCPHKLPAGWAWAVADEVVQPGADIVYGIVQPGPKLVEGVPYVRGMDIVDGVIQTGQLLKTSPEIAQKYERASLKGGDILLGIIRATKVAIVPSSIEGANITQGTARFRPSSVFSTEYLAYWLASKTAQSWLHSKYRGIDMPGLNLRDVRQLPVPLAPVEEQREIVRRIETAFAKIDRLAAEAEKALKLTDRLDQRILAKAFAGELVPQDPTDEPATELLARIREARATGPKPKRGRRKKVTT